LGRLPALWGDFLRFAVVPVPASESFGAEPLVFRANDDELAKAIVSAAGTVLGELRLHEDVAL
jgi:hypothetical protein